MLMSLENRDIYLAGEPVDFRLGINGLSEIIQEDNHSHIYDGSIYVFYNSSKNKIKCLYWDGTGFVLYYKRMDQLKFNISTNQKGIKTLTQSALSTLLAGMKSEEKLVQFSAK